MSVDKYAEAGVDVNAGYESVDLIKKHVKRTHNKGVMSSIGGFAGLFDLSKYSYDNPVLVSGTDGVGTKLELCRELERFDSIGIDLVAMCVNDIVTIGARPLFFLDYIAVEKNIPTRIEQIVKGICDGLNQCDCALLGGETAEMPGVYHQDGFDLAGFVVGVVEKDKQVSIENVKPNQIVIGLPSSGIHSNGYSLVRKIVKDNNLDLDKIYADLDVNKTLGDVLLEPTRIYVEETLKLLEVVDVKGISHITGGGFYENIKRVTGNFGVKINYEDLNIPNVFKFLKTYGNLDSNEMFGYFNMGYGMVYIINEDDLSKALNVLPDAQVIGIVTECKDVIIC